MTAGHEGEIAVSSYNIKNIYNPTKGAYMQRGSSKSFKGFYKVRN